MWLQEHELVTAVELPLPPEGLVTGWDRRQVDLLPEVVGQRLGDEPHTVVDRGLGDLGPARLDCNQWIAVLPGDETVLV